MRLWRLKRKALVTQKMARKPQFRQSQQPQEFLLLGLSKLRSNKREHLQPSWLGGAGGAAASRRKRDDSSPTEYLSFLDATEALIRTARLGFLAEADPPQALMRILQLHGHGCTGTASNNLHQPTVNPNTGPLAANQLQHLASRANHDKNRLAN